MLNLTQERPVIVHSLIIGFIVAVIFIGIITIVGELIPDIKNWLKDTHSHHWVGKGIWTMILFITFSFIGYLSLKLKLKETPVSLIRMAGHIAIFVSVAITLFFIYEYVIKH